MSTEVGALHYDLSINDKTGAQLDRVDRKVSGVGSKFAVLGKTMAAGFAVAGTAAVAFGIKAVKAFEESQNVIAQTNNVIKSTGAVAGVSAKQVSDLASSLQAVTMFSDETIQSGENLLLTFTNIGKDIFPQATETMLDMSQALGQDVKSSAIQLGKALQDPILGVTALRRVGVNFNQKQQDVIKSLVESGKSAEAQRLILKELRTEFGGSAKAAGDTFAGKMAILKNSINDVEESIGLVIVRGITPLAQRFATFVASDEFHTWLKNLWQNIVQFAQTVVMVAQTIYSYFAPSFEAIAHTISNTLMPSFMRLWNAIQPGFTASLILAAKILGVTLVVAIYAVINVLNIIIRIFGLLAAAISNVISWVGNLVGVLVNFAVGIPRVFRNIAHAIEAPFKIAFNAIAIAWNNTIGKLSFRVPDWVPELGGKGWSVPKIPTFAKGITDFKGGLAYVHQGELLVNMPKGTDVVPKSKVQQSSDTRSNTVFNIGEINNKQDEDWVIRRINHNQYLETLGMNPLGA